jgi:NTE family protein
VFQGGGVRGIAYVGALKAYVEHGPGFAQVKRVMGTSAGGITAALVASGMDPSVIGNLLAETDMTSFMDLENAPLLEDLQTIAQGSLGAVFGKIFNHMRDKAFHDLKHFKFPDLSLSSVLGSYIKQNAMDTVKKIYAGAGLNTGEKLRKWIEEVLKKQTGIPYITFREWRELFVNNPKKRYKHLYLVCTELTEDGFKPQVFSSEDAASDDLIISDVVRCTTSIPGVFQAHRIHRKTSRGDRFPESDTLYIDGGLLRNYPIDYFDRAKYQTELGSDELEDYPFFNSRTLGFSLRTPKKIVEQTGPKVIKGSADVIRSILYGFYYAENTYAEMRGTDHYRTIYIDDLGMATTDFSINDVNKEKLRESGFKATQIFFSEKNGIAKPYMGGLEEIEEIKVSTPVSPIQGSSKGAKLTSYSKPSHLAEDKPVLSDSHQESGAETKPTSSTPKTENNAIKGEKNNEFVTGWSQWFERYQGAIQTFFTATVGGVIVDQARRMLGFRIGPLGAAASELSADSHPMASWYEEMRAGEGVQQSSTIPSAALHESLPKLDSEPYHARVPDKKQNQGPEKLSSTASINSSFNQSLSGNEYLSVVVPYVGYFVRKHSPVTLPWNEARPLTLEEKAQLKQYQAKIPQLQKRWSSQQQSTAAKSGMFEGELRAAQQYLDYLGATIDNALKTGNTTTAVYEEMEDRFTQLEKLLKQVSRANHELRQINKHVRTQSSRELRRKGEVSVESQAVEIQRDVVNGQVTHRFLSPEDVADRLSSATNSTTLSSLRTPLSFWEQRSSKFGGEQPIAQVEVEEQPKLGTGQ